MIKTFQKLVKLNLDDLFLYLGVEGGLFLLIQIVIGCVMYFARPDTSVTVSCIVFPIVGGFTALVAGTVHMSVSFDQALCFGQTRRRALGLTMGLITVQAVFALAVAAVLTAVERFLCVPLWAKLAGMNGWMMALSGIMTPALPPDYMGETVRVYENMAGELVPVPEKTLLITGDFTLDWYWWLLIFAAALVGATIIGALVQRFGSKGLWVIWALCVGPSILSQLLPWDAWAVTSWTGVLAVVIAAVCAGFVWSVWSLLHAVVRA